MIENQSPCFFIVFPFTKRVGRIRETALKLNEKPTEASASYYRKQVSATLTGQLEKIGVNDIERMAHLAAFWLAVDREAARLEAQRGQA